MVPLERTKDPTLLRRNSASMRSLMSAVLVSIFFATHNPSDLSRVLLFVFGGSTDGFGPPLFFLSLLRYCREWHPQLRHISSRCYPVARSSERQQFRRSAGSISTL